MSIKFSLILPFYNEKRCAELTLKLIYSQTVQPNEVLFINSNSNDNTDQIIANFINKNNLKNWKIFNTKYETPSEAKNFGITMSKFSWCAFMDFDLFFSKKWVEDQINFLNDNKNILISYGTLGLNPTNYFDKLVVCQTYGINSLKPIIPSSFIHKDYFYKFGNFYPYRSFYDKIFIQNSLKKSNSLVALNKKIIISYQNINYASNIKELFLKTLNYTIQSVYIKGNKIPYIYFFLLFIFSSMILVDKTFIFPILIFLIILRGILIPHIKNQNMFKYFQIRDLLYIFLIGIFIDLTKLIGFLVGFILKLTNKKIRLDQLYK